MILISFLSHTAPPSHYTSYGYDEEFPVPPSEELVLSSRSPPSPVSSSYSELRHTHSSQRVPYCSHATQGIASSGVVQHLSGGSNPQAGATYAPLSQTVSRTICSFIIYVRFLWTTFISFILDNTFHLQSFQFVLLMSLFVILTCIFFDF